MNTYEIIKKLSKERGLSIRQLEIRLGFSNGYFSKWKSVSPNSEGLKKVADYFDVSVDYLLGRETTEKKKDNFAQFFKMKTDGLSDDEIETLKEEWLDYLEIRTRRMEKRNSDKNKQ